jgi:beta-glucanase (GH16 family)
MSSRGDAEARRKTSIRFPPRLRVSACYALAILISCTLEPAPVIVWNDEFEGPAGLTFDRTKWVADTGGAGWGNQERQFYTTRPENAALDGEGHLVITARAPDASATDTCWYGRCRYTSARLKTKGLFAQTYGRFEARIRVPKGQGIWPAFWMLGDDIDVVGWPKSGEIDVMENIGREPSIVHGTLHGPGYSGAGGISRADTLATGAFADDFHVFAVEWNGEPQQIRWFVDGRQTHSMTPADLPPGTKWVFDHPFFLLLNLAVGGQWPGDPDASTTFPQQMIVDYVRVYGRR